MPKPKKRPETERELSRLELAVLGLVFRGAPCTAYWIRRQFQTSLSSFFSGSAGAVYPAVRRLEARSLVKATTRKEGRRRSVAYSLTPRGAQALEAWLSPPFPLEDVAFTMDPIRTRVHYLNALSAPERRRFVAEALEQTRRRAEIVESESLALQRSGDEFGYLGGMGVVHEVRARVRWLEELELALETGETS